MLTNEERAAGEPYGPARELTVENRALTSQPKAGPVLSVRAAPRPVSPSPVLI